MESTAKIDYETLLRAIGESQSEPWYPRNYSQITGIPRDQFDGPLNDLRLAGLIRMTEWTRETGQGYLITASGKEILINPQMISRLKLGIRPTVRVEEPGEADQRDDRTPTTLERGEAVRKALLMPERARITWMILYANIAIFAVLLLVAAFNRLPISQFLQSGDSTLLHRTGALMFEDLVRNEWWRLLTCCFLHFGIFHLAMNMMALYFTGSRVESFWGRERFLVLYLFAGIGGATVAMIFDPGVPGRPNLLAGASGAIWGLMCSAPIWIWLNREFIPRKFIGEFLAQSWTVIILNVAVSFMPNVSKAAHFGGGIVGIVLSFVLYYQKNGSQVVRQLTTALLLLFPVVCYSALNNAIQNDPRVQRIVLAKQALDEEKEFREFASKLLPIIKEIDDNVERVDRVVTPLINQELERRDAMEVKEAKQFIDELLPLFQPALALAPEKVEEEAESVTPVREASRGYLVATQALTEKFLELLDQPTPQKEVAETLRKLRSQQKLADETLKKRFNR